MKESLLIPTGFLKREAFYPLRPSRPQRFKFSSQDRHGATPQHIVTLDSFEILNRQIQ